MEASPTLESSSSRGLQQGSRSTGLPDLPFPPGVHSCSPPLAKSLPFLALCCDSGLCGLLLELTHCDTGGPHKFKYRTLIPEAAPTDQDRDSPGLCHTPSSVAPRPTSSLFSLHVLKTPHLAFLYSCLPRPQGMPRDLRLKSSLPLFLMWLSQAAQGKANHPPSTQHQTALCASLKRI